MNESTKNKNQITERLNNQRLEYIKKREEYNFKFKSSNQKLQEYKSKNASNSLLDKLNYRVKSYERSLEHIDKAISLLDEALAI